MSDHAPVVLVAGDPLGERMAGPAIRVVELARALAAAGLPVVVAAPDVGDLAVPGVVFVPVVDEAALRERCVGARAVVAFSAVAADHLWLFDLEVPIAVDAYDPGLLETLERFRGSPLNEQRDWVRDAGRHLLDPLARADVVLVASERQRHYVLGLLTAAGRVNPRTWAEDPSLRGLCRVVPFGVAEQPPELLADGPLRRGGSLVASDAVVALWGGGLYDWLDPLLLVEGVARARDERVTAVFLAGPHPTPAVGRSPLVDRVRARADGLGLLGSRVVLVEEWVPYGERAAWLTGADMGVSLHRDHLETTFAFRTRILDYLWAGLPVVATEGDHFAEVIARHDLGVVVPYDDAGAVGAALDSLASVDPGSAEERRASLARQAEASRWSVGVAPLVEWCRSPRLAADRRS